MELNVYEPSLDEQLCAKALIGLLKENEKLLALEDAVVHHKFPLYMDSDSSTKSTDVMIVSKNYGILIFKCIDCSKRLSGPPINEIILDFEQIYSLIFSKLIKSRMLRDGPLKLNVQLRPIIYFLGEACDGEKIKTMWNELEIIEKDSDLNIVLNKIKFEPELNKILVDEILSILEGSQSIRKKSERPIGNLGKETKGTILDEIEKQIAIFDKEQKRAALKIIDGPQRIRGLAGSGKTIVLAMKVARIHLEEPNSRILYTYWTKQLHDYIKKLITRFYRQFSENDPDWTKIDIMHAWGGRYLDGVYYNTCINNGIRPQSFGDAKEQYGKEGFNKICEILERYELKESYDYSILDEAQDFPVNFYRICRKITKNDRVIWGYDECQNILDIKIQDTVETFGKDDSGKPYIDFSQTTTIEGQDMVLYKCYRNPRSILVAAIALGFGIFSDRIIQLPENMEHWEDLGFKVSKGKYKKGDQMIIIRPEENSPLIKNKLLDKNNNAIRWKIFKNLRDECQFVTDRIIKDLQEGLLPEDIMVISIDDRNARLYFDEISRILVDKDIKTFNLLKQPSNTTDFIIEKYITLTTVYRAKGNEAGCVYIIGVDSIFYNKDSIVERNKLFTAITRANAWVTITGLGEKGVEFDKEIKKVIENNYQLNFVMPDLNSLKKLQRNLAIRQAKYIELDRYIDQMADKLGTDRETLLKEVSRLKIPK